ncbi:hypothetical protein [Streptomyces halobius]|uniref:Uncharacterized protein n=1 Tax=Streptomyces halobius TaxID=2879846 RepID=A0ABY4MH90_9ACTN|nr:hypothetical protein [Streptomyces halobius]UQA95726.1 hypothetical protein K9S39_31120 [Streptomyces halobius]
MSRRSRRAAERQKAADLAAARVELTRLRAELDGAREELAVGQHVDTVAGQSVDTAGLQRENSELRRRLELSERARASLDIQIRQLQRSHDFMCREAVDRAGTLAPVPKAGEPQ